MVQASLGKDAVALAEQDPPDLLVVDIGLPDADGRDVTQAIRSRGIESPVLFLSARDQMVDRLAGFSAGGDDYLTKPFEFAELIARLRALLRALGREEAGRRSRATSGWTPRSTRSSQARRPSR